jgi:carbonic anhydrase
MRISLLKQALSLILLAFLFIAAVAATGCSAKAESDDTESASEEITDSESDEDNASDDEDPDEESPDKNDDDGSAHKPKKEKDIEKAKNKSKKDAGHKDGPDKNKKSKSKTAGKETLKKEKRKGGDVTKLWSSLMEGNRRFAAGKHTSNGLVKSRKALVKGQQPDVIVISCSDSRVPPELVFDKNLGELFVIRTAGNVADRIALGSIEYAAEHLHSKMLVVLGHETCGAVAATLSGDTMPTKNLRAIVNAIRPAFKGHEECKPNGAGGSTCVKLNVTKSAQNMIERSPILKELVADGSLHVVHAIYEMESGKVVRF